MGGYDSSSHLATVEKYEPQVRNVPSHIPLLWSCARSSLSWPPPPIICIHPVPQTPGHGVEVCTLGGGLLVVGLPPALPLMQVNSWTPAASMLSRRSSAGVAVLEGALYVAGGNDGTSCLNSVERYSPKAGAWESVAPMNIRRCRGPTPVAPHSGRCVPGPDPCTLSLPPGLPLPGPALGAFSSPFPPSTAA